MLILLGNHSPHGMASLRETRALQEAAALVEAGPRQGETAIVQVTRTALENLRRKVVHVLQESFLLREGLETIETLRRKEAQNSKATHIIRNHIAEISVIIFWS